jgi:hypothetical protein
MLIHPAFTARHGGADGEHAAAIGGGYYAKPDLMRNIWPHNNSGRKRAIVSGGTEHDVLCLIRFFHDAELKIHLPSCSM